MEGPMNDDLRDRLDAVERAAGETDEWTFVVAFQRKPDGPLLDDDGDPLPGRCRPGTLCS